MAAANLERNPTPARPFKPHLVIGAAAGSLRELIAPAEANVLTVTVYSSVGGAAIPFRVYGHGEDDAPEDGTGDRRAAANCTSAGSPSWD